MSRAAASGAVLMLDEQGRIARTNRCADELFGYEPLELVGRPLDELVPSWTRTEQARLARGAGAGRPRHARRRDGTGFPAEISVSVADSEHGSIVTAVIADLSHRLGDTKRLQRAAAQAVAIAELWEAAMEALEPGALMRRVVERIRAVLAAERASVFEVDEDGTGLTLRAACGWPPGLLGRRLGHVAAAERVDIRGLAEYAVSSSAGAWIRHGGRRVGVLAVHGDRPAAISGDEQRFLVAAARVLAQALERRDFERRLRHQALHDPLTGAANRALFLERLEHWQARAARTQERAAVLYLDVDSLKHINDALGHEAGDTVLRGVAYRLRRASRGSTTIARLGGDEFAILLEGVGNARDALAFAGRIQGALGEPMSLDERVVTVSASIGISLSGPRAPTAERMLRNADAAMYAAKRGGRERVRVFGRGMHAAASRRQRSEQLLRDAIARNEFTLLYQPVVSLSDDHLVGFEALLRLRRDGHLLPPGRFIALAEETSLILPLGMKALQLACAQAAEWQHRFREHPAARVSVNLSPRQLAAPELVGEVARTLRDTGLEPGRLALEVAEPALGDGSEAAFDTLTGLSRLGVSIMLDDFGTGHASLSDLSRYPIRGVKIDGACIESVDRRVERQAVVAAVTAMASGLQIAAVAEGVQTAGEHDTLREMGCEFAQGFYFARPLRPDDATHALTNGRS